MSALNRLNEVIKTLKSEDAIKDQADIAAKLGYNRSQTISDITTGRTALTTKFVKAFCNRYGVSEKWINTGKGEWREFSVSEHDISPTLSKPKEVIPLGKHSVGRRLSPDEYAASFKGWLGVPMYNAPITASFVETYRDETFYKPQYYLHDPRFKDCQFGAIITGDSMHSEIRHGDFVACQEVTDWSFVVYGDIYYIVSTNGLETCKYLNADPNDNNNFLLVPRNEAISPSPIPKEMIHKMYKVRGIIRGY